MTTVLFTTLEAFGTEGFLLEPDRDDLQYESCVCIGQIREKDL